ncbi:MAG: hypothetical protein Q7S72_01065, partial [Candidatus Taylorbacteria bacterium]|nr:hypothetical protein [Candidatus Taylorbacteria bacterium]
ISAGGSDQKIPKHYAFWTYIEGKAGAVGSYMQSYAQPADTTDDSNGSYVIPEGKTVVFTVESRFNPKVMFAGSYHGIMRGVSFGDWVEIKEKNTTNDLVVIGEKSPYINSVSPVEVPLGGTITIEGARFSTTQTNKVSLTPCPEGFDCLISRQYNLNSNGKTIQFVIPDDLPTGNYILQITHPTTGASNIVSMKILPKGGVVPATRTNVNSPYISYISPTTPVQVSALMTVDGSKLGGIDGYGIWMKNTSTGATVHPTLISLSATQIKFLIPPTADGSYLFDVVNSIVISNSIPIIVGGSVIENIPVTKIPTPAPTPPPPPTPVAPPPPPTIIPPLSAPPITNTPSSPGAPNILTITPSTSVKVSDSMTVTGVNFAGIDGYGIWMKSSTGTLVHPTMLSISGTEIKFLIPPTPVGSYIFYLVGPNGTSNSVPITVVSNNSANIFSIFDWIMGLFK